MSAGEVALAYDTALLLLRLIGAGVAAAPTPAPLPLPNLGFLRPCPSEVQVRKVADLLRPLTEQSLHRRVALARTMQSRVRTAGTAQSVAKQLEMPPQTVRDHLGALRSLYGNDLDFGADTLAILAAVDLVLPLWELEEARRTAPAAHGQVPGQTTRRKPPRGPDDLP